MTDAGEIIKSGAFDKLADIIHKLAGPMADEIGLLMADKIKIYRVKNWINVVKKTQKILAEAELPANAVPPRLLLPILEASSVESDDTLQDLWAGLLASASTECDSLSPSFIETLKQLTPAEAKALDLFFDFTSTKHFRLQQSADSLVLPGMGHLRLQSIKETFERLGLFRREYHLKPHEVPSWASGLVGTARTKERDLVLGISSDNNLPELTYRLGFTEYGFHFMQACRGPKKEDDTSSVEGALS